MKYAIITAGGSGSRMGAEIPKQFMELNGKPVLMHTIERFFQSDKHIKIIISLPEEHIQYWENLCEQYKFTVNHTYVKGGQTRFHSVKNALAFIYESGLVAVHDGVRPLVSTETIRNTFSIAKEKGNAVAYRDIVYSVRKIENDRNYSVDRTNFKEIQTPQTFRAADLKKAYEQPYDESFTDDASVVERMGILIHLTEANEENIKITHDSDLLVAEALLNRVF